MATGIITKTVALDGSGAGTDTISSVFGELYALRVEISGGTPSVTVEDATCSFLDTVAVSANTTYYPSPLANQSDDGTQTTSYVTNYYVAGTVTITVTGGAVSGSVTVQLKVVSG